MVSPVVACISLQLCMHVQVAFFSKTLCVCVQHPRNRNSPICYDFVKKQCVRGPECRYSHDLDSIIHGTSLRDAALLARYTSLLTACVR